MQGKKTGGRKPGTQNKITHNVRELVKGLLDDYAGQGLMSADFLSLDPKERLDIATKLLPYVAPKMQTITVDSASDKVVTIEDRLLALTEPNRDA